MGGMGGADMGGFNNPFDLFEQVMHDMGRHTDTCCWQPESYGMVPWYFEASVQ